jgi:putative transposase
MNQHKKQVTNSWRLDETYIKVSGNERFLYRAVDKQGNTIDFLLTKRRIAISTGFKEFESAQRTLARIEVINMIRKDQILKPKSSKFKTFCTLAS